MHNIPTYQQYNGETKIALIDNSTIAFLEKMERCGVTAAKELLRGDDVIFIPNWVLEEVSDVASGFGDPDRFFLPCTFIVGW